MKKTTHVHIKSYRELENTKSLVKINFSGWVFEDKHSDQGYAPHIHKNMAKFFGKIIKVDIIDKTDAHYNEGYRYKSAKETFIDNDWFWKPEWCNTLEYKLKLLG